MPRRILIVVGHPDPAPGRFVRALADAYAEGAAAAGHDVRRIDVAALDVPLLRTRAEFESGHVPPGLERSAEDLHWAEHVVFLFPLWLGAMPAMFKAFLEQVMRPGVAFAYPQGGRRFVDAFMRGRSARIVVTMAMPALLYRLWFLGHGVAGMRRNILRFVGFGPVRETLFGMVEGSQEARRARALARMRDLGRSGA